jgi:hypothetical protein
LRNGFKLPENIDEEEEAKYYKDLIVLSDDEDNQKDEDFETYRSKLLSNLQGDKKTLFKKNDEIDWDAINSDEIDSD